ncbi:MAG: hypothetical protein C0P75_011790 [Bacilli bacterium]|uniref:Uncharacterized protein n=1 Tax=Ureibacillus suwonensis TaxID=313007 RepID=A0ABW0RG76_9BACL
MEQHDKAERLKVMLEQAFQPLHEKIDRLENEVKALREELKNVVNPSSDKE